MQNNNLSYHDYLTGDAASYVSGNVVPIRKERNFLKNVEINPFCNPAELERCLLATTKNLGVHGCLSQLTTNTEVARFGILCEKVYAQRDLIEGAQKLCNWIGANAPAAFAASPCRNSGLSPSREIPGAEGIHQAPPNTPLREALRPPTDGHIMVGENYSVYGRYDGREIQVCGEVRDLGSYSDEKEVPRASPAPFLSGMGVDSWIEARLIAFAKSKDMAMWDGKTSVSSVVVLPSGRVWFSPGQVASSKVHGLLSVRRKFCLLESVVFCDRIQCRRYSEHYYRFALSYGKYAEVYCMDGAWGNPPDEDQTMVQFFNRCFKPVLQSVAASSPERMDDLLAILCNTKSTQASIVNKALQLLIKKYNADLVSGMGPKAGDLEGLLLDDDEPMVEDGPAAPRVVAEAQMTEWNDTEGEEDSEEEEEEDDDDECVEGEDDGRFTDEEDVDGGSIVEKKKEKEKPKKAEPVQAKGGDGTLYTLPGRSYLGCAARDLKRRDCGQSGLPILRAKKGSVPYEVSSVPPALRSTLAVGVDNKTSGCVKWDVFYQSNNTTAVRMCYSNPKKVSNRLFLLPQVSTQTPVAVVQQFNRLWKVAGVAGGGAFAADQKQALAVMMEHQADLALFPSKGCVLYGPVTILPKWWAPKPSPVLYDKTLFVATGVFFTVVDGSVFGCHALGVDADGMVHANAVCMGSPRQVVAFMLEAARNIKVPGVCAAPTNTTHIDHCGVLGRVYLSLQHVMTAKR